MIAPTAGYAVVGGKDIRTQMNQIREDIGICLQHDCLFPTLTVKEHVQFFARVKGLYAKCSKEDAEKKIMESIEDVALAEKQDTFSKNLSGGMKRKLSVAIAFCGDSKTVLLDEPTSGKSFDASPCPEFSYIETCLALMSSIVHLFLYRNGPVQSQIHVECHQALQGRSLHHSDHPLHGRGRYSR